MPFGEYPYTVDDKGRVVIPSAFRDFVQDGLVVTRGMESCLYLFPTFEWARIEQALLELPLTDASGRSFVRFFYSGAAKLKLDSQGRVGLPPTLRTFAGLESDVLVAGAPKRLELWNAKRWNQAITAVQENPPDETLLPEPLRRLVG